MLGTRSLSLARARLVDDRCSHVDALLPAHRYVEGELVERGALRARGGGRGVRARDRAALALGVRVCVRVVEASGVGRARPHQAALADQHHVESQQLGDARIVEANDRADAHVPGALDHHVRMRPPQPIPRINDRRLLRRDVDVAIDEATRVALRYEDG